VGKQTAIAWTDHTFNAWWGCQRVSPGCEHCYAETFDARVFPDEARTRLRRETNGNKLAVATHWGAQAERRTFGEKHWREPLKWNAAAAKAGKRARVFCSSMADVFEDRRELDAERAKLWPLITETPWLDWQLLTKRPENMVKLAPASWRSGWPSNVWAGCTVESQEYAEKRICFLSDVPARVRFLSCEPLLGPVDLSRSAWIADHHDRAALLARIGKWGTCADCPRRDGAVFPEECGYAERYDHNLRDDRIHWVIIGGESGPGARPFHLEWARQILHDCQRSGTAAFMKQMGSNARGSVGDVKMIYTGKGDEPSEWADEFQVQEFPA
jgi:protein gp37